MRRRGMRVPSLAFFVTIVVEFESYDRAVVAYKSEVYEKALRGLGSGAERDFRIVEGA